MAIDSDLNNEQWIAGLHHGEDHVLSALRERLFSGLRAALGRRGDVHETDLDDFAQEALLRIVGKLDTFRGESRFTTWAMAIAVRTSLTQLRRRTWSARQVDQDLETLAAAQQGAEAAETGTARDELFHALRNAIDETLTARQRKVLLGELEGIPSVRIAEHLGAKPGAVYKLAHDARRKLKRVLSEHGFDATNVRELLAPRD